jgi:hypothetical protein
MIWFRFYDAERRGKKMIESGIDNGNSNTNSSNN